MEERKPDLVVWDKERGYYQRELTYGSNNGAPAIKVEDVKGWKGLQAQTANKHFKTRYGELKEEFQRLVDEVNWNELVFNSQYNIIPIVGETYHLYIRSDETTFLSLIKPEEWNKPYIGSFRLDSQQKWIKIK